VDISYTGITSVAPLKDLPHLEKVTIWGTGVTDGDLLKDKETGWSGSPLIAVFPIRTRAPILRGFSRDFAILSADLLFPAEAPIEAGTDRERQHRRAKTDGHV
jgi:hypothetical protein